MTIRQIKDVCDKGYRYDIEHDRFISDEEDKHLAFRSKMNRAFIKANEFISKHQDEIRAGMKIYHEQMKEIMKKRSE